MKHVERLVKSTGILKSINFSISNSFQCCCSKYVLKKHEEIHKKEDYKSEEDDTLFKCSECPRRFREQFLARRCARRHSAKRLGLYECQICKLVRFSLFFLNLLQCCSKNQLFFSSDWEIRPNLEYMNSYTRELSRIKRLRAMFATR